MRNVPNDVVPLYADACRRFLTISMQPRFVKVYD